MPRRPLADKGVQTSVRLPRDLYDRLISAAGDKGIGEEIRQRLEASFSPAAVELADPRLRDLLAAISRAAVAASKLHPLPAGIREDEDGNRVTYEVSDLGPDRSAYVAFREAVTTLLDAFGRSIGLISLDVPFRNCAATRQTVSKFPRFELATTPVLSGSVLDGDSLTRPNAVSRELMT